MDRSAKGLNFEGIWRSRASNRKVGIAGDSIRVRSKVVHRPRPIPRRLVLSLVLIAGISTLLAILIGPSAPSTAHAGNTGGSCDSCHASAATFMTVTGFPATYTPGQSYSITVTITDGNGWPTGENSFDMIVSGGTVKGVNQWVKNVTTTEVATNDAFNSTARTWTVNWTAPASGTITVDTWGVYGSGAGWRDPYQHLTTTVNASEMPEFTTLIVPIAGILATLFVVRARRARRKEA